MVLYLTVPSFYHHLIASRLIREHYSGYRMNSESSVDLTTSVRLTWIDRRGRCIWRQDVSAIARKCAVNVGGNEESDRHLIRKLGGRIWLKQTI